MFHKKFILAIKWSKNDNGGDRRPLCIEYDTEKELQEEKSKILSDFRTIPMPKGFNGEGKIPYSVSIE